MKKFKISVIVPIAPGKKPLVLESIKRLDYPKSRIQIVVIEGRNPSENRNKGVERCKADLIAFVNAHSLIEKNWAKQVLSFFKKNPKIDIVGGPQLTSKSEKLFGRASGFALSSPFGSGGIYKRYNPSKINLNADETMLTSANLICKKRIFEKVRFDETLYPGEDPKFIEDALKSGFRVAYSPKILVYNIRRVNLPGLFRQIFNYGRTRPRKERFIQTLKRPYFFIPCIFVIYLLLLPSLSLLTPLFAIPLGFYLLLLILFSLIGVLKSKIFSYLLLLPLIFFVIHLSYGFGFIYGYIQKMFNHEKK